MGRASHRQVIDGKKWCPGCQDYRDIAYFNRAEAKKHGLSSHCKTCTSRRSKVAYALNPEKNTDRLYKIRYGAEASIHRELFELQNGVCAACGRPEETKRSTGKIIRLSLDHDHLTGKVRGLLCQSCNRALGDVEDDPKRLLALLEYLQKHQEKPNP